MDITQLFSPINIAFVATVIIEIVTLFLMKSTAPNWIIMSLYALIGYILRIIIKKKGLLSGNASFDILGVLTSTAIATFYFKEKVSNTSKVGIVMAFISLYLLNL